MPVRCLMMNVQMVILIGVACLLSSSQAIGGSAVEVFARAGPTLVVVQLIDESGTVSSLGSGVAVGPGHVVTNCHVALQPGSIRVKHQGKSYRASVARSHEKLDACELRVPSLAAAVARLGSSKQLRVGQTVFAIGAPQGLELTISEGLVSSLRGAGDALLIQTSAPISPGSSGGGLFDSDSRLVGITTFYLKDGQNLNFAVPVDWIRPLKAEQTQAKQAKPAIRYTLSDEIVGRPEPEQPQAQEGPPGPASTTSAPGYKPDPPFQAGKTHKETVTLEEWVELFGDYEAEKRSLLRDGDWVHLWEKIKNPDHPMLSEIRERVSYNCAKGYRITHVIIGYQKDGRRVHHTVEETIYPEPTTIYRLNFDLLCQKGFFEGYEWKAK